MQQKLCTAKLCVTQSHITAYLHYTNVHTNYSCRCCIHDIGLHYKQLITTDRHNCVWLHRLLLTHCGRVTQICVFTLQLCRAGDADLRF